MANVPKQMLHPGLVRRLFEDIKLLVALIRDYWKGAYRDVSMKSIVLFTLAILYILSPLDIIPDFYLGFGQIDDAAVFLLCLNFLEKDLYKYKAWKIDNKKADP